MNKAVIAIVILAVAMVASFFVVEKDSAQSEIGSAPESMSVVNESPEIGDDVYQQAPPAEAPKPARKQQNAEADVVQNKPAKNAPQPAVQKQPVDLPVDTGEMDLKAAEAELKRLAAAKQWELFTQLLNNLNELPQKLLSLAVVEGIKNDAPVWVFEDLIFKGAEFEFRHLSVLATQGKVELMKSLQVLGLDIYMVDKNGVNAIHYLVRDFQQRSMVLYLFSQGIDMKSKVDGKDPLQIALEKLVAIGARENLTMENRDAYDNAWTFCGWFIDAGTKIRPEHIELVRQIKAVNERTYLYLIGLSEKLRVD